MGYMRYRKYYAARGNSYGGYKKKKSYGAKRYTRKKSSLPSNRGTHQFDFVDNVNQPTNTWFSTGKKQDFCQAQRTYNVSGLLWGIHQTKIFVTGVKLTLSLFRMNSIRSELAAKAVNWRVMLCDSVVFNACEQFNRENLSFSEGMKGSIDGLNVGFTSLNTVGMMTSIHQKMIKATGDCETRMDSKGTLCHGMRTSVTLNKWVKIGKWLNRDTLHGADWSRNIYLSVLMECMGNGVLIDNENYAGFGGSGVIYYRYS